MAVQKRTTLNEIQENQKYRAIITNGLKENKKLFCPFRKERQMEFLFQFISSAFRLKNQRILEVGCGYGRLIHFLNQFDPQQQYTGIDYVKPLIKQAKKRFKNKKNINFEVYNAMNLSKKYNKCFDITFLYKTLSWLPYYQTIIREMIKATKRKIFITALFCEGDIDYLTMVNVNPQQNPQSGQYLNTYSFPAFKKYCLENGAKKVNSKDFHIDIDLPRQKNKNNLHTHTISTKDKHRLEVNGPIIQNWKLIEIVI